MKCRTLEAFGLMQKIQEKRMKGAVRENLVKIMTNDYSSLLTSLMTDSNEHIQWIHKE